METALQNRISPLLPLVVVASLALTASAAWAGVNTWTTNGPGGPQIQALAIDPSAPATLYAGTSGGAFKSTDGGGSWTAINAGLSGTDVNALAIDPSTPATLYAVTNSFGVFKSTDGGGSWTAINTGLPTYVDALAIDPAALATLYAGTDFGVFKSTDGGGSWTAINAGLSNTVVLALSIDPAAPATLYAGTFGGVFKSTNGGASWTAINIGLLPGLTDTTYVYALAIDPSAPATLYAAMQGSGVFKSTNGGGSWTNTGLPYIYMYALAIDPSAPATLYTGTSHGVYKSTNGAGSWTAVNTGLNPAYVHALAMDPSASALYAGTLGGVSKSTNGGTSWTAINIGLLPGLTDTTYVYALAIDPSAPATLYAGTSVRAENEVSVLGAFKSTDGGGTWTGSNTGLPGLAGGDLNFVLAIDPSAPATLYAGIPNGVFKSTNGGEIWTATGLRDSVSALVVDPTNPATLYAATTTPPDWDGDTFVQVFKSTDRGASWSEPLGLTGGYVFALAIDPSAPATLYAGTDGGVFKSTNAGVSWSAINAGLGLGPNAVSALVIEPTNPATLYAGVIDESGGGGGGGVFKSANGGGSWMAMNTGLTNTSVQALVMDPSAPATLYAGTFGGGVFKSTNAGASWTAMNAGLASTNVIALAVDPSTPARIYAGTDGSVYEYLTTAEPCVPSPTALCLSGGRFEVTTRWTARDGQSGAGQAVVLPGGDTGYFTFFTQGNVEVAVKILNGCSTNGRFWALAGGLTDLNVVMTVTDSGTGDTKTYTNPQQTPFRPILDTSAFDTCAVGATAGVQPYGGSEKGWLLPPSLTETVKANAPWACVANATTLCLNNARYQVQAQWATSDGASGAGQVINLTGDTGAFWFFDPSNVEMVVKVLNACGVNSRYWTFAGGLTDVNVILTVTDTQTGAVRTYTNPQATAFQPIQDTDAFLTCP